ncbi:hypothetical protein J2785_001275 [Burkholderia ambifaria]|nr:hypothetical protein [Burkholderia ambifaria]
MRVAAVRPFDSETLYAGKFHIYFVFLLKWLETGSLAKRLVRDMRFATFPRSSSDRLLSQTRPTSSMQRLADISDSTTPSVVAMSAAAALRVDASGIPHLAVTVASERQRDRFLSTLETRFGDGRLLLISRSYTALVSIGLTIDMLLACGAELALRGLLIELAGAAASGGWPTRLRQAFGTQ